MARTQPASGYCASSSALRPWRELVMNRVCRSGPPKQGMVGQGTGVSTTCNTSPQVTGAAGAGLVLGGPVAAVGIDRRAIGAATIGRGTAPGPACGFGHHLMEQALARELARCRVKVKSAHLVRGGVGPIRGASVRRPGQAIGGRHAALHGVQPLVVLHVQHAECLVFGFVQAAGPKASLGVALAVVEALLGGVIRRIGQLVQRATPIGCPVDAAAQRQHQATALDGGDAAGFFFQRPVLCGATRLQAIDRHARHTATRDVHPIQAVFLRVPERRLAQAVGLGGQGLPGGGRNQGHASGSSR